MSTNQNTTNDEEEEIVTCSELLERIDDEEAELDRERALYGNCDTDSCTYSQVIHNSIIIKKKRKFILCRDTSIDKPYLFV